MEHSDGGRYLNLIPRKLKNILQLIKNYNAKYSSDRDNKNSQLLVTAQIYYLKRQPE